MKVQITNKPEMPKKELINGKDPDGIKRHLHPTKGWKKGKPRVRRRSVVAVQLNDGKTFWETPNDKKRRQLGGMFTGGNGYKQRMSGRKEANKLADIAEKIVAEAGDAGAASV